jgi:hypothetical protein
MHVFNSYSICNMVFAAAGIAISCGNLPEGLIKFPSIYLGGELHVAKAESVPDVQLFPRRNPLNTMFLLYVSSTNCSLMNRFRIHETCMNMSGK